MPSYYLIQLLAFLSGETVALPGSLRDGGAQPLPPGECPRAGALLHTLPAAERCYALPTPFLCPQPPAGSGKLAGGIGAFLES